MIDKFFADSLRVAVVISLDTCRRHCWNRRECICAPRRRRLLRHIARVVAAARRVSDWSRRQGIAVGGSLPSPANSTLVDAIDAQGPRLAVWRCRLSRNLDGGDKANNERND